MHIEQGAAFRVLGPAIDTLGPIRQMVLGVLGMVAEMERGTRERQDAGIARAKAAQVCQPRPPKDRLDAPRRSWRDGESQGCGRGGAMYKALTAIVGARITPRLMA